MQIASYDNWLLRFLAVTLQSPGTYSYALYGFTGCAANSENLLLGIIGTGTAYINTCYSLLAVCSLYWILPWLIRNNMAFILAMKSVILGLDSLAFVFNFIAFATECSKVSKRCWMQQSEQALLTGTSIVDNAKFREIDRRISCCHIYRTAPQQSQPPLLPLWVRHRPQRLDPQPRRQQVCSAADTFVQWYH